MVQNTVHDIKPHPYIGKVVEVGGTALASTIGLCLTTLEQQIGAAWEMEIGMNIHPLTLAWANEESTMDIPDMKFKVIELNLAWDSEQQSLEEILTFDSSV